MKDQYKIKQGSSGYSTLVHHMGQQRNEEITGAHQDTHVRENYMMIATGKDFTMNGSSLRL